LWQLTQAQGMDKGAALKVNAVDALAVAWHAALI